MCVTTVTSLSRLPTSYTEHVETDGSVLRNTELEIMMFLKPRGIASITAVAFVSLISFSVRLEYCLLLFTTTITLPLNSVPMPFIHV